MMSKNLYINLVLFVSILLITCFGTTYYFFVSKNWLLGSCLAILLIIECNALIRYLNKTNRRMAYFIDSIRNDDTSIQLPKDIKNKAVTELYSSLSFLNDSLKKIKIEIGYNEQMLKTLIEYSATGFITIDSSGGFEVLNHHARKYLDIEYTSNLQRLQQIDPQLYHIFTTSKPGETKTHRIQRNEQAFILSVSVAEIKYHNENFKVVSLQDISRELDEQELESWHKLFRVITHEIMNSIAPITSLANKLTKDFQHDGKCKTPDQIEEKTINNTIKGLHVIDDMSNGLMNFVQNYRQLSKIPKPNIAKIDLRQWLTKLKTLMLEMIRGREIELNISVSNNCQVIYGDEKLLNQVLLNIVKNAIDALEDQETKDISIGVYLSDNGKTIISVKDTGTGIAKDDLEKVFVPFFTTKDDGNGIGLSLSKQILKLHGGRISIQSKVGEGTQVMLSL